MTQGLVAAPIWLECRPGLTASASPIAEGQTFYHTTCSQCNCAPTTMASIFKSLPLLRTAAPRLTRQFFTCQAHRVPQRKCIAAGVQRTSQPSWILQCHYQSTHAPQHVSGIIGNGIGAAAGQTVKKSTFPQTSDKSVAYWLLGSAASVFGIVIFGGLTRLTESGCDITTPTFLLLQD
jgi:hypothetical protein